MSTREKPFPQRTCTAPNYRIARFQKGVEKPVRQERQLAVNLRSKLLHARIAIFANP